MTIVLEREINAPVNSDTTVQSQALAKPKGRFSFVNFIAPKNWEPVHIPEGTKNLILGIPGFLCTPAALNVPRNELNNGDTMYIDWGSVLNIGFTKRITSYLVDYADYLTQTFGGPIDLHGNSLGGFDTFLVAVKNPGSVRRINLTAVPHLLSMDEAVLREHTNIAPFLGLMRSRLLGRFYDQEMMENWELFRNGEPSPQVDEIDEALKKVEIASWAAKKDSTVSGKMCGFLSSPDGVQNEGPETTKRRFFVVDGDHSDVVTAATPAMGYLTGRSLHEPLPPHISESILSPAELEDLQRRTSTQVAIDFVLSSLPNGRATDCLRTVANVPISLSQRVRNIRIPSIDAGISRELGPIST